MRLVVLGAAMGVAFALALGRIIAGLLSGVGPHDPATFAAVVVLLLGAARLACWFPARRASRVNPLIALRAESPALRVERALATDWRALLGSYRWASLSELVTRRVPLD